MDFQNLIGMQVRKPSGALAGHVAEIIEENDAHWHKDYIYILTDRGDKIFFGKVQSITTEIKLNSF